MIQPVRDNFFNLDCRFLGRANIEICISRKEYTTDGTVIIKILRESEEEFYFESKESHYFLDINVFLIITDVRGKEKRKSERRSVD